MFSGLKNHPFAIQAHFEYSVVLSYAIPKNNVKHLLPSFLSIDLFQEEFAFFTLAFVKVNSLRPRGFHKMFGQDFQLIGHRLFVQYKNAEGKRLRGLCILKSQTDKKQMVLLGNAMTHYKYEKVRITSHLTNNEIIIKRGNNDIVHVKKGSDTSHLPIDSVFSNWKEARRFAGPLPFTFSALKDKSQVLIVQGLRDNWTPVPLEILEMKLSYNEYSFMQDARLSNAFVVENIPYQWKKGIIETWEL